MSASAMHAVGAEAADDLQDRLSTVDFQRLSAFIGEMVGIKLPPAKRLMVEGRIRKRVRSLGLPSMSAYCHAVIETGQLADEIPALIDAITTNKTDFFREPDHYSCLREIMIPELLANRRAREGKPLIKFWSAAASNGAEAYSAAMVLGDLARERGDLRFAILGTDISTAMLDQARLGLYPAEMLNPVPVDMRRRYVMTARPGSQRTDVRIAPELRRLVGFQRMNLMDQTYPFDRDVDIIFLRNVLIYFEKADQQAVVDRLFGHLRPGGYLVLGHSESMIASSTEHRQIAPAVFQKA